MKRILLFLALFAFITPLKAQLAENSWSFGFGGSYPRLMNHNLNFGSDTNYGGFFHLQRNTSEHVAFRIQPGYSHMEADATPLTTKMDVIALNLDFLYFLAPCDPVSPYFTFGAGGFMVMLTDHFDTTLDDQIISGQLNMGLGADIKLSMDWSMFIEFNYHSTFTDELDGYPGSGFGGILTNRYETYLDAKIGWNYYFEKGTLSRKCALPGGMSDLVLPEPEEVDYDRIDEMIKTHIPRVITREVVVEKEPEKPVPTKRAIKKSWVLEGVKFRSGSANLTNQSYPILYDAIGILKSNPGTKIEIQGHTDSSGGAAFNMTLSERRARAVKEFLVANGISASRLSVRGYGETHPIADNYTSAGRAVNRRIEFKVVEK